MSAHKDIEKQLAEAQNAWEEQPAPELWGRLESQLDAASPAGEARKPKNWPFRILLMLLLPLGCGLWYLLAGNGGATLSAKAFAARTHSINLEGSPIAARNFAPNLSQSQLVMGNNLELDPSLAIAVDPMPLSSASNLVELNPSDVARPLTANMSPTWVVDPGLAVALSSPTTNTMGFTPQSFNSFPPVFGNSVLDNNFSNGLPLGNLLVTNGNGNPIDTVHSLDQFSNMPQSSNTYLQLNANRNFMHYDMRANPRNGRNEGNISGLQELNWLLGSWKTEGFSGAGYEEWRQKDEFTIEGKGFFVVNGDTLVTEQMRIEQHGPAVYYIVVKDTAHKAMKFRLRSQQPNELIFQNEAPRSQQEFVIRSGPNQVEKILQSPVPAAQGRFNNNDNTTSDTKRPEAVRILRR